MPPPRPALRRRPPRPRNPIQLRPRLQQARRPPTTRPSRRLRLRRLNLPRSSTAPASVGRPAARPSAAPSISFPDGTDEVLIPTTQMRKGIATQMTKALLAPHAYVQMEVDVTRLVAFREKAKRDYQAKEGIGL